MNRVKYMDTKSSRYVLHPIWKNISLYKEALLSEICIEIWGAELSEAEISVRTYRDNLVQIYIYEKVRVDYGHPPSRFCKGLGGPMGPSKGAFRPPLPLPNRPPGGTFSKILWQVYECN